MKSITLLISLGFAAAILWTILRAKGIVGSVNGPWPYVSKRLLSQPEQVLYHRLVAALPDHIILAQVQVSRVLGIKKGYGFHAWNNRINRLSYDFVVCAKDFTVVAAIELDDDSHATAERAATDDKKDKATASAGIRLIRWQVRAIPSDVEIKDAIANAQPVPA